MGAALGVLLLAIGAVLRYAVTDSHWEDINLDVTGTVLMIVGVIALIWSVILYMVASNREDTYVEHDRIIGRTPDDKEEVVVRRKRRNSPKK